MTEYKDNIIIFRPDKESDNEIKCEHKYNTFFRIPIPNIQKEKLINSVISTYRLIYKTILSYIPNSSYLKTDEFHESWIQTHDPEFMMSCPDSGLEYINSTYAECGINKSDDNKIFLTYKSKIKLNDVYRASKTPIDEIIGCYLISVEFVLVDKN